MISKLSQVQLKTQRIESKLKQMKTSVYNLSIFIIIIMVSIIRIAFHLGFWGFIGRIIWWSSIISCLFLFDFNYLLFWCFGGLSWRFLLLFARGNTAPKPCKNIVNYEHLCLLIYLCKCWSISRSTCTCLGQKCTHVVLLQFYLLVLALAILKVDCFNCWNHP